MECEEEEGRMAAETGDKFGRLFTVGIIQLPFVDIVTKMTLNTLPQVINAYFRKEEIYDSKCPVCRLQVFQRRESDYPALLLMQ